MAAPFLRSLPVFRQRLLHLHHCRSTISAFTLGRPWSTVTESTRPDDDTTATSTTQNVPAVSAKEIPKHHPRFDDPNYRKWKDKEALIWSDIEDVTSIVKEILHSERYMDGERLTPEDEKIVVERLLAYHPHSDDKIGCGLDSIMVDRHPQFRRSRCLFVVRTDGGWIDFSYQKCLRAYIRAKYPSHADRFIKEHFKRGSN
ncbi:OLC1v1016850C1 [Oldenlandia corymbosa var. corymbosa]|uniref:OLC1v1016850C1 n=1 Tax=Oldenlandia corymbosa var. corymbosa TaxID=529605 RepID=A0AAV1E828_OLDCO|nr:OLC1v1016850C1 [Oldenlandia corymbosa var. corymbosa]